MEVTGTGTRRNVDVGSGHFTGTPVGGRLCSGPVVSSTRGCRVRVLCRDARRGPSILRSGRLVDTRV